MNIFQKYILKRAEQIKAKEASTKEAIAKQRETAYENDRLFEKQCREDIRMDMKRIIKEKMNEEIHLKVGDEAVINIYNLVRNSSNGWDGGSGSMTRYLPSSGYPDSLKVKITQVYIDDSLFEERLDKFFDEHSTEYLKKKTWNGKNSWTAYAEWQTNRYRVPHGVADNRIFDRWGLYWTAKFSTEEEFQPSWGLNIHSFLAKGDVGYDETLEIASLERSMDVDRKMHQERLRAAQNKIDDLKRSCMTCADLTLTR